MAIDLKGIRIRYHESGFSNRDLDPILQKYQIRRIRLLVDPPQAKGLSTKKKYLFLKLEYPKNVATMLEGGGVRP